MGRSELAAKAISAGEYENALEDLDFCLKRYPDWVSCVFNKGVALWNLGSLQEALPWFEHASKLAPEDREIQERYSRALEYLSTQDANSRATHTLNTSAHS